MHIPFHTHNGYDLPGYLNVKLFYHFLHKYVYVLGGELWSRAKYLGIIAATSRSENFVLALQKPTMQIRINTLII